MGSGLILLVIVGAWLAVLVPMALRSHDSATSLRSADRFGDAMRVLSRRGTDPDVLAPRRRTPSLVLSATKSMRPARVVPEPEPEWDVTPVPTTLTAAERRRRTLSVLAGLSLITLGAALMGASVLWPVHVVVDLLLVTFVVHLRRQAVRRAQRAAPARRPAPVARRVARGPRVAGIPDRMPARPAPLTAPLPAPAARYEDRPVAATGTDGTWSPVPVPPPSYVGKATAPRREPRVLDLTHPGSWSSALDGDDAGLGILDDGLELDEILTRRRAVND